MATKKKRGGPKEKISDEMIQQLGLALKAGSMIETAAQFAGIDRTTFYTWMNRGREEVQRVRDTPRAKSRKSEAKYVELYYMVQQALAESEVRSIGIITNAQKNDWRAAAWKLEHRDSDRWGTRQEIDAKVSGSDGGPIKHSVELDDLTTEQLKEKAHELIKEMAWLEEEEAKILPNNNESKT